MATPQDYFVCAARDGNLSNIEFYIEQQKNININARDSSGNTALIMAAWNGRSEAVQYLLEHGARIDICDKDGRTPLHAARSRERDHTLAILLKAEIEQLARETPAWSLFSPAKLAHVEISPATERKLTEIFNFESRERLIISENLKTSAETMTPPISFDALPSAVVETALRQFHQLGGVADEGFVIHGTRQLDKNQRKTSKL